MNPLCKYCGKPMSIDRIEYTDVWYSCSCDGYLKEKELEKELKKIKSNLSEKEKELQSHKDNSLYECLIRDLKQKIEEIEYKYRQC